MYAPHMCSVAGPHPLCPLHPSFPTRPLHGPHPHGLFEPLHWPFAAVVECEALSGDQLMHYAGNEHFATDGMPGDTRSKVHVASEEVVAFARHLAGVKADADTHPFGKVRGRGLDGDGAAEAVGGALEGDHVTVAHRLHDIAMVLTDFTFDEGVVLAEELHPLRVTEPFVQRRGVLDVGEEEGDGAIGRGLRTQVGLLGLEGGVQRDDGRVHVVGGRCPGGEPLPR